MVEFLKKALRHMFCSDFPNPVSSPFYPSVFFEDPLIMLSLEILPNWVGRQRSLN